MPTMQIPHPYVTNRAQTQRWESQGKGWERQSFGNRQVSSPRLVTQRAFVVMPSLYSDPAVITCRRVTCTLDLIYHHRLTDYRPCGVRHQETSLHMPRSHLGSSLGDIQTQAFASAIVGVA